MQENSPHSFRKFKKVPFFVSILLVVFSCFAFFFLYEVIKNNQELSRKTQIEWQAETDRREGVKSLEHSIKAVESQRILLESHFAQSSNVVPFLDTIEKLALEVQAKSEVVSVDIPKEENKLLVAIKASGSFEALYKFLTLLENSPYELEFISMDLQKSTEEVSPWTAVFRVKLLSFIL